MNAHFPSRFPSRLLRSLALLGLPLLCTGFCSGCSLSLSLDPKQGQNAAVARGSAMESSTATLVRLLESDDPQVRSVAVRGLAEMGPDARGATPALHRLIDDPDRHVRYESAKAVAAVNPEDPVLPAMLVQIANDQRTPEEQRVEIRSLLQRVSPMMATTSTTSTTSTQSTPSGPILSLEADGHDNSVVESEEVTAARSAPATQPTGLEIVTSDAATTRPVMASERSEQINESAGNGSSDTTDRSSEAPAPTKRPAAPATRPATPATGPVAKDAKTDWSEIPGLAGLANAVAQDPPPTPDINLFGYPSYTSASAVQVKDWIQRQASLTEQEKQARIKEFQDWRYAQDKLIYQKVLDR